MTDKPSPTKPFLRLLWVGRGGLGLVWRGTEHQIYRDLDGTMGKRLTHHTMPHHPN